LKEQEGHHCHTAAVHPPACPPGLHPTGLPTASSKRNWETFSRPNRILSCWSHTWEKKEKKKKQNSESLNPKPVKSFSTPCYTEKTGGLQHRQMQAPSMLGRRRTTGEQISRQTGLDAKGVTPELIRLKFYCS
jgi:hypothetical protein